jgi:hypothetical protein
VYGGNAIFVDRRESKSRSTSDPMSLRFAKRQFSYDAMPISWSQLAIRAIQIPVVALAVNGVVYKPLKIPIDVVHKPSLAFYKLNHKTQLLVRC